jgi:hypothetical protein
VSVWQDEDDPNCPVIIYLPLKRNDGYSKDFCPQENQLNGGYCLTYNFSMTNEQVDELSGLTNFNFHQAEELIRDTILQVIERKTHQLHGSMS